MAAASSSLSLSSSISFADVALALCLVALPGAMTGVILAGGSATEAIRLQLVVMYMLLGGNAFAALVAGEATVRRLFTGHHQLIRSLRRVPT